MEKYYRNSCATGYRGGTSIMRHKDFGLYLPLFLIRKKFRKGERYITFYCNVNKPT